MAREFLLIPKAKYESMLKTLDAANASPSKIGQDQHGGQVGSETLSETEQENSREKTQPSPSIETPIKPPPKLHVKRTLSEMEHVFESSKRAPNPPKRLKWVNYLIS